MPNHSANYPFGTVYRSALLFFCLLTAAMQAQTYRNLHTFDSLDGDFPDVSLIQASDGNLYGTASCGGAYQYGGTLFRVTPHGNFALLHSFGAPDKNGSGPSAVVQASDGNLYGVTAAGANTPNGTFYRSTLDGAITTLHIFQGGAEGSSPIAGLTEGQDGNFYGTTFYAGAADFGTIFKVTPSGTLTTLYSFSSADGFYSYGQLVQDTLGNFYGTTSMGGSQGYGTVFKVTAAGEFTKLHDFTSADGTNPLAALVFGPDGNLYGTASAGGDSDYGTVYRISPSGVFAVLHHFTKDPEGAIPYAPLILGSDGSFYGTTAYGGSNLHNSCFSSGCGTAFRITPVGELTTLISFGPGMTGSRQPRGGLIEAANHKLYGNTSGGGSGRCYAGCGTIFVLSVGLGRDAIPGY